MTRYCTNVSTTQLGQLPAPHCQNGSCRYIQALFQWIYRSTEVAQNWTEVICSIVAKFDKTKSIHSQNVKLFCHLIWQHFCLWKCLSLNFDISLEINIAWLTEFKWRFKWQKHFHIEWSKNFKFANWNFLLFQALP